MCQHCSSQDSWLVALRLTPDDTVVELAGRWPWAEDQGQKVKVILHWVAEWVVGRSELMGFDGHCCRIGSTAGSTFRVSWMSVWEETKTVYEVIITIWNRIIPRALVQNQHTRELISDRNTWHKYKNKDLSRLSVMYLWWSLCALYLHACQVRAHRRRHRSLLMYLVSVFL